MLEQLFGSKARSQLLQFIFFAKLPSFGIKDVSNQTNMPLSALRKEWELFLDMGLLKESTLKEASDEERQFCVNQNFVFFKELQHLVLKDKISLSQDFSKKILLLGDIRLFLLTGIFLEQRTLTQTDILIVGKTNRFRLKSVIQKYEHELGAELFYTILSEKEYFYRLSIADYFLYTIVDNNPIIIVDQLEYDSSGKHGS